MEAIIRGCLDGVIPARVAAVIAPSLEVPAAVRAHELGIDVRIAPPKNEDALIANLADIDWVCLAGFLRLLPVDVIRSHPGRVLNIHPALLPKFGGKGMYGQHVHEAVIAAGERESGCTVHFVSDVYDEGAIIAQKNCEVRDDDSADSLAARVLKLEHQAYVEALSSLIHGRNSES